MEVTVVSMPWIACACLAGRCKRGGFERQGHALAPRVSARDLRPRSFHGRWVLTVIQGVDILWFSMKRESIGQAGVGVCVCVNPDLFWEVHARSTPDVRFRSGGVNMKSGDAMSRICSTFVVLSLLGGCCLVGVSGLWWCSPSQMAVSISGFGGIWV